MTSIAEPDYWSLLGLEPGSSQEQLKRAFRQEARRWHPDLNGNDPVAEERFKLVNEAYAVLSDPRRRRSWEAGDRSSDTSQDPFASGFPHFEDYLEVVLGIPTDGYHEAASDHADSPVSAPPPPPGSSRRHGRAPVLPRGCGCGRGQLALLERPHQQPAAEAVKLPARPSAVRGSLGHAGVASRDVRAGGMAAAGGWDHRPRFLVHFRWLMGRPLCFLLPPCAKQRQGRKGEREDKKKSGATWAAARCSCTRESP